MLEEIAVEITDADGDAFEFALFRREEGGFNLHLHDTFEPENSVVIEMGALDRFLQVRPDLEAILDACRE